LQRRVQRTTTSSKKPKSAKPAGAKKPPGPYIVFCSKMRPTLPKDMPFGEQGKALGAMWAKLTDAEKAKYKS